jgi:hypothetical protein
MTIIESRRLLLLLAVLPWVACAGGQGATAKRGPGALPVRVAAVQAQDVTYRVKALGSLEAEELVQVTAEVDGAVAAVDFHEGDRVTSARCWCASTDRYRLEAERTQAYKARRSAGRSRLAPGGLAKEQLVALG